MNKNEQEKDIEDPSLENEENQGLEENENTSEDINENSQEEEELDEMDKLKMEKAEMHNKYVRLFAEFDNYKRRTSKEKIELISTAGEKVIKDILPVIDDFERAIKTNELEDEAHHNEGFLLIRNKLLKVLGQKGLKSMEALGKDFDPDLHHALTEVDAPNDADKGKVFDVIEEGYYLNDKIIRYAKVVVAK